MESCGDAPIVTAVESMCKLMSWRPRLKNPRRSIQHDWVEYSIDKPPSLCCAQVLVVPNLSSIYPNIQYLHVP